MVTLHAHFIPKQRVPLFLVMSCIVNVQGYLTSSLHFFFWGQFKNYSHDVGKAVRRVPKRKQMAKDTETKRRSALNVRLFLREFCLDFLENCYNHLMYLVKVSQSSTDDGTGLVTFGML